MSVKISSLVWEYYPNGGGEMLTALAFADHAHDDGTGIRPSVEYTARKTRQSKRTVQMHLARMREFGWLLTVRHAAGGYGRTTEYRVNPAWIANPAEFAPLSVALKRVQQKDKKGAIDSTKGCKAFAPQPSRTVIESTTTGDTGTECRVVVDDELIWPSVLSGGVHESASHILKDCPLTDRQNVLYEIAGLADRGDVRHPIGLLRRLVERARQGQFVPAAALDYQRKLKSLALESEMRIAEERLRQEQSTPHVREVARAHLALIRKQLNDASRLTVPEQRGMPQRPTRTGGEIIPSEVDQ